MTDRRPQPPAPPPAVPHLLIAGWKYAKGEWTGPQGERLERAPQTNGWVEHNGEWRPPPKTVTPESRGIPPLPEYCWRGEDGSWEFLADFQCPVPTCGKRCTNWSLLHKHYKVHLKDARFLCACGKGYIHSYSLQAHRRTCSTALEA